MNTFTVHILAANRPFYEGSCEYLSVPAMRGQYGVMAHHSNIILALKPGEMHYRVPGGENEYAWVSSGMMKVEDNDVLILVDTAERPEEIDDNRARREEAQAKEALLQKRSIQEYSSAQTQLARAVSRLKVKREYTRSGKGRN